MKDVLQDYCLTQAASVDLDRFDAAAEPLTRGSKSKDRARLDLRVEQIGELQNALFAERRHSLLVLFQGMDTSGKDGTIYRVFGRVHPLGMRPFAFKAPSPEELEHDFLWRIHGHAPQRGEIAVWNRSHYEDVVTARVLGVIDDAQCAARYGHINDFERLLRDSGVHVIKVFLNVSRAEQKLRLERRLTDPRRHWKFSPQDLDARVHWKDNLAAYARAFEHTSIPAAPWWIVPADSKVQRDLMVAEIVWRALKALNPEYPALDPRFAGLRVR